MRDLKVRQVNPRALNAARYNPRRITPRELEKLRRSIRETRTPDEKFSRPAFCFEKFPHQESQ